MRTTTLCLLSIAALATLSASLSHAQVAVVEEKVTAQLSLITDVDTKNKVESMRTGFKFDKSGRRVANKVVDARERLLATEEFTYDRNGKLAGRVYKTNGGKLKWQWRNVTHNAAGDPVKNDIVNAKGKRIGWYTWKYKDGQLQRRDRFEANGKLRFYYADMKFDKVGNYSTWTKFDSKGRKTGTKQWKFEARK